MTKEIFSKDPQKYNLALAEALKKIPEFQPPEWALYVKTGCAKQRPPEEKDFWYKRAASVLRQLYLKGVIGVQRLRKIYGSKKKRGVRPNKFKKASGKIIRTILQQGEKVGFIEKVDKLQYGRRLTKKGRDFLDSIKVEVKNG
ncbi:MAG: 30S ribosomal protein S19e [Candidatus Pacearchaeota archaeon]